MSQDDPSINQLIPDTISQEEQQDLYLANFLTDQKQVLPVVVNKELCSGKTFIVTGGNTGLGYEAVKHFVQVDSSKVIMAVRSISKGESAKARIEDETGVKGTIEVWPLDMSSYDSIKTFAEKVSKLDRIDAVVENAAVALDQFSLSEGLETSLVVNVTGTMLLAALVLPKLEDCAKKFSTEPHLSIIGSSMAFTVRALFEKIDGDILNGLQNPSQEDMKHRYALTKLLLWYAYREFASLKPVSSTGVVINYVHPGLCSTEMGHDTVEETKKELEALRAAFGRTAEEGSRTLLHGAVGGKDTHGKYLSECEDKEQYVPKWMKDESGRKMQKRTWDSIFAHLSKSSPGWV